MERAGHDLQYFDDVAHIFHGGQVLAFGTMFIVPVLAVFMPVVAGVGSAVVETRELAADELGEIGHDGDGFCFDNETPRHRVWLDAFEIASHPVTHGDFLAFIADGGYRRPELWLSLGWDTVQAQHWEAPLYWRRARGGWEQFTLSGPRELRPDLLVALPCFCGCVSYAPAHRSLYDCFVRPDGAFETHAAGCST